MILKCHFMKYFPEEIEQYNQTNETNHRQISQLQKKKNKLIFHPILYYEFHFFFVLIFNIFEQQDR